MSTNPKKRILQIANHTQNLTVSIQSSSVLGTINKLSLNASYNDDGRYLSKHRSRSRKVFLDSLFNT